MTVKGATPDAHFWNGKTVFLTGHTGFKGGWLALWLHFMGAKVVGYSLEPDTQPNYFEVSGVKNFTEASYFEDIRNQERLQYLLNLHEPEIVIHMAAQALVRRSYENPMQTITSNVIGTANLLDALRYCDSVRAALIVTSDKCYENLEIPKAYIEKDPMGGYDVYSASKGCAELITASYRKSFFSRDSSPSNKLSVATARAGNVIGGGDWSSGRLVPDILKSLVGHKALILRNPGAIRPWQHVLEPLNGYLVLCERLFSEGALYGSAWNFGPVAEGERTVAEVVTLFQKAWGINSGWELEGSQQPHEAGILKLDHSKATQLLNWKPRWAIETAILKIVEWEKARRSTKDMAALSLHQISEFIG